MPGVGAARWMRLAAVVLAAALATGCSSSIPGSAVRVGSVAPEVTSTAGPSIGSTGPNPSGTSDPPQDRQLPTPPTPTPAPAPAPAPVNPEDPYDLQVQHDGAFGALMKAMDTDLMSGNITGFLAPFAPSLATEVRHWFSNTRSLGVAAALFAPSDDYTTAATDSAHSFTRSVVLGVRTPYDDDDSMPGIVYGAVVSVTSKAGRQVLTITSWQPRYVDDPMFCSCTRSVVHTSTTAVVTDAGDDALQAWSGAALDAAGGGIAWSQTQLEGSGLVAPKGRVIFLADKPFRWFISQAGAAQTSNVTAGLLDAQGRYPGTRYSRESRIVLTLQAADGSLVPDNDTGREYAADVITHESTHQLMNRNSTLPGRSANSPPTWVVEGIAVAVETLYRDSLGDGGDVGYPEPNDPKNIPGSWFAAHLTDQMPTQSQLYSSSSEGAGYYAISGSVFRYIFREYGYVEMMKVAKAMYAKPAQSPFSYFPDRDHPGSDLPAAAAKSLWKNWFVDHYE